MTFGRLISLVATVSAGALVVLLAPSPLSPKTRAVVAMFVGVVGALMILFWPARRRKDEP